MAILYPKEANKVFVLPINKLALHTTLEKLDVLWKDSQLHESVNSNQVLQLKESLDNGAEVNSKNIVGDTVLHIATRQDYLPIISLLLEKGALANISNNKGETPLEIVDRKNDAVVGKAFIDTVLNKDPKAEKPKLTMRLLSNYWVEQSLKQANKSTDQEFIKAEVDTVGSQRVKELVRCFFSKSSPPMDEQSLEKNNVASLTK